MKVDFAKFGGGFTALCLFFLGLNKIQWMIINPFIFVLFVLAPGISSFHILSRSESAFAKVSSIPEMIGVIGFSTYFLWYYDKGSLLIAFAILLGGFVTSAALKWPAKVLKERAITRAENAGRDCALHGANHKNSHPRHFVKPELKQAWEFGRNQGVQSAGLRKVDESK